MDKVLDMLAGLRYAQFADMTEKGFASVAAKAERLRGIAHVEGQGRMRDNSKHLRRSLTELAFAADLKVRLHQKFTKQDCSWTVRSLLFPETID